MKKINDALWLIAGLRTPFAKVDKELKDKDVFQLSIPIVREMLKRNLITLINFYLGAR